MVAFCITVFACFSDKRKIFFATTVQCLYSIYLKTLLSHSSRGREIQSLAESIVEVKMIQGLATYEKATLTREISPI